MEARQSFGGKFSQSLVRDLHRKFKEVLSKKYSDKIVSNLEFEISEQTWTFDEFKEELFAEIDKASNFSLSFSVSDYRLGIRYSAYLNNTRLSLEMPSRDQIEKLLKFVSTSHEEPSVEEEKNKPIGKEKHYYRTAFPLKVVKEAYEDFMKRASTCSSSSKGSLEIPWLRVKRDVEEWSFASLEEFFTEAKSAPTYHIYYTIVPCSFKVSRHGDEYTSVEVELLTRSDVQAVFGHFEAVADHAKISLEKEPVKVFIGHGRDSQWRDLKDHLQDQHGITVVAYEIGPRAGLGVKEVLEGMLNESSFALLVLTGEDVHADGEVYARGNVIHELGLFQGRLGFTRAVALLEDGVSEFSNILGVNQIRFPCGEIRSTFGDVIATIKREFEDDAYKK